MGVLETLSPFSLLHEKKNLLYQHEANISQKLTPLGWLSRIKATTWCFLNETKQMLVWAECNQYLSLTSDL